MKKISWYSRREVALYLFPSSSAPLAVARLRRWLLSDPSLLSALRKKGYRSGMHHFSPAVRQVLIDYIGKG